MGQSTTQCCYTVTKIAHILMSDRNTLIIKTIAAQRYSLSFMFHFKFDANGIIHEYAWLDKNPEVILVKILTNLILCL